MQLTAKQLQRIQTITNLIERYYGADGKVSEGNMVFRLEVLENGNALLSCANDDGLRWYETFYYANIVIAKQGGIRRYAGTMRPKLALPATPHWCEYTDPFKKSKNQI